MKSSFLIYFTTLIFLAFEQILCTIKVISLRSDLITHPCVGIGAGTDENTARKGWLLSTLLGNDKSTYKTLSLGIWYKFMETRGFDQYNFGITNDKTVTSMATSLTVMSFWHLTDKKVVLFQSIVKDKFGVDYYPASGYLNEWKSVIMHQSYTTGVATMIINFPDFTKFMELTMTLGSFRIPIQYPNSFINANYAQQNVTFYNSCSKHKDLQFHYSVDEDYTPQYMNALQFQRKISPVSYYDFRVWNADSTSVQSLAQKFKNLVSFNEFALNGNSDSIELIEDAQYLAQNSFFIPVFNSNQFITLPSIEFQNSLTISFIPRFSLDVFAEGNQIRIFYQINPIIEVYATYSSAQLKLLMYVKIGSYTSASFQFGSSLVRHTIQFQGDDTTFATTIVKYFAGSSFISQQTISTIISFNGSAYIGNQPNGYIAFSLSDFLIFTNSQVGSTSIFANDTDLQLPNCDLYISFGILTSQAYCLACSSATQTPTTQGVCKDITAATAQEQIPVATILLTSNLVRHLYSTSHTSTTSIDIQKSTDWDFLVIGYFKLLSATISKPMSLILIEVPNESYYFLHLTVVNQYTIKLKQLLNQIDPYDTLSITYSTSLVGRWVPIGLGYKSTNYISYVIYDSPHVKGRLTIQTLSNANALDTAFQTVRVSIAPIMTYSSWYSNFNGETSTAKIIYSFDTSRINSLSYLLESERTSTPYYNGISSQLFSQQVFGNQFLFACEANNGMFFEGTCITTGYCASQMTNGNETLGINNAFFDDTTNQQCRICDGNCETCTLTATTCLTCRSGMRLDATTKVCSRCSDGMYFNSAEKTCTAQCAASYEKMDYSNRICVESFNASTHSIQPSLQIRQFKATLDFDFQTLTSDLASQRIAYSCWILQDSPYPYNFLGSSGVNQFTFLWENLPKNYQKQVTFILVIINSSNIGDVSFSINGIPPTISASAISLDSASTCYDESMNLLGTSMSVYEVTLSLINNSDNFELSISSSSHQIGIRNIKPLAKRCSPSCNSCSGGGSSMHCSTCFRPTTDILLVQDKCVCPKSTYQSFQNCYSSPCYSCTECRTNCLSCEDITGNCSICASGYVVYNGNCVAQCPTDFPADPFYDSSVGTSRFCIQQRDFLYANLQNQKIRQSTEFWSRSFDMTGPSSCFSRSFFSNFLSREKTQFETDTLPFKGYHVGFEAEITILVIDSFDEGQDFAIVNINDSQVLKATYPTNRNGQGNGCGDTNVADGVFDHVVGFNTTIAHIKFEVVADFDQTTGESMSMEKFKLFQKRSLDSLCETVSSDRISCDSCVQNAILLTTNCSCKQGYFYDLDYLTSRGKCSQCFQNCKTCNGPSPFDCLTCAVNYLNNGSLCMNVCSDGQYRDEALKTCVACDSSCVSCIGPGSNQCTSCYKDTYLYNRVCYSSCSQANPKTIANEWKRTCEAPNEVVQLSSFFNQTDYFPELISKYIRTSDSLNLDVLYACEQSPIFNTLGLFSNQMQLTTPILGPHQALRYSFLLYSKCPSSESQSTCSMNIQVVNSESSLKTISFAPTDGECAISKLYPISVVLNHQTSAVAQQQILISSSNLVFSVSSIQISTIICHATCKSCNGPLITDCLSCPSNSTLNSTTKKCICDDASYGFGTDTSIECTDPFSCLMCLPCVYPCSTCFKTDTQSCNSCTSGKFLQQTLCTDSCPANTTIPITEEITGISKCDPCPSPCETCNYFGICNSCIVGYLYIPDQKICALACPEEQYYQKENECLPCLSSCNKCSGELPTECLVCNPGFFLDSAKNECLKCNDACSTCTGPSTSDCIECALGMVYFKPYPTIPLHYCSSACTEVKGYYQSQSTCLPCNPTCSSCSGSGLSDCFECIDGYYLSHGFCLSCSNSCLTCSGSSSDDCTSCASPLFLNGSQCSGNCLKGTYGFKNPISGTFSCQTCPSTCLSCESETSCTSCSLGYYLQHSTCLKCQNNCEICFSDQGSLCQKCNKGFYLQKEQCYSKCPSLNGAAYYGDPTTRKCQICDSSCKTCEGPYSFQCLSCSKGYYLLSGACSSCPSTALSCYLDSTSGLIVIQECIEKFVYYEGTCYQSCPQGTYQNGYVCYKCDVSCRSCLDETSTKCSMCAKGFTLLDDTQTCQACSSGGDGMGDCEQCSSIDVCDKCSSLILYNNKCLVSCPATFYLDSDTQQCQKCHLPCIECTDATTCTKCDDGYFYNGTVCQKCNAVCLTCSGGNATDCTLCMLGLLVQVQAMNSICTKICDPGFYADTEARVCSACDSSCLTCSNSNSCELCQAGFFKDGETLCKSCSLNCERCTKANECDKCKTGSFLSNGTCINSCPAGTIGLGALCVPCSSECSECSGAPSTCTKCKSGSFLMSSQCIPCNQDCTSCTSSTVCTGCNKNLFLEDGECKTQCTNAGKFSDLTSMTCQSCEATCDTCIGPYSRQCTSCGAGKYMQRINEGIDLGVCDSCHTSCSTCFGSSNSECNSCMKGIKYLSAKTTCVANLSSYYYDEVADEYKKCSTSCQECTGPESNNCTACKPKYFLTPTESTCTLCPDTCTKCSSNQKCVECVEGYALFENSKCLNSCPKGMRMQNGVCLCHSTCGKCEYDEVNNSSVCKKCAKSKLYLVQNSPSCIQKTDCSGFTDEQTSECLDSCPTQKFEDQKNRTCSYNPCPRDTFTLSNKYCVEACPEGTFTDSTNKICVKCNSKCKTCTGPSDSECDSCSEGSLTSCKDICVKGYIQEDLSIQECTLCVSNCKICFGDMLSFEKTCLKECPIGYKAIAKRCLKSNVPSVRIKKFQSSKISIEEDLEIEAELSTTFSNPTVSWKNSFSTDSNFSTKFPSIASQTLVQFIPYIQLIGGNVYTLQVTVSLPDGTLLMDEISFETETGIKPGQFVVDRSTGQANLTPFIFQFSGWTADQSLYFSLNFYELVGLVSAANLTNATPSEYRKDNLFQVHQNTTLDTSRDGQVQMRFPAFNRDINIIAELHIYNANQSMKIFSYLMIDLKAATTVPSTYNIFSSLKNSLDSLNPATDQLDVLLYAINFNMLIPISNDKLVTLREQKDLRIQARRMKISTAELPDCDSSIDCFGNGVCLEDLEKQSFSCECDELFIGTNCEWTLEQSSIISDSAIKLETLLQNISSYSIQLQIQEIILSYAAYFVKFSNLQYIITSAMSTLQTTIGTFFNRKPDAITGQLLSRCLSTTISTLQSIGYNVKPLLKLQSEYQHLVSNNMNVGDSLVTSSESCESLLKPLLIQPSNSSSSKRLLANQNLEVNVSDMSISFPPEVVQNNKKQVVQVQKWKQPSRSNPNAISQSVSISMSQSGSEVAVNNLSVPIIFTLPKSIPSPVSSNPEAILCTYYDESTSSYSSEGCTFVKETITDIVCSCVHLTEFQAATNPQVESETVSISSFLDTFNSGKQIVLSKQNTKQVVNKLPVVKLGARSVSLTSQLVNMVTTKTQKKKQVFLLAENESLVYMNFNLEDKIEVVGKRNNEVEQEYVNQQLEWSINKKYILVYALSLFTIALFLSVRAGPSLQFIPIEEKGDQDDDEQQPVMTSALLLAKIQRQKKEMLNRQLQRKKKQKLDSIAKDQTQKTTHKPVQQIHQKSNFSQSALFSTRIGLVNGNIRRKNTPVVKKKFPSYDFSVIEEVHSEEVDTSIEMEKGVESKGVFQFTQETFEIKSSAIIKQVPSPHAQMENWFSKQQKESQTSITTSENKTRKSKKSMQKKTSILPPPSPRQKLLHRKSKFKSNQKKSVKNQQAPPQIPYPTSKEDDYENEITLQTSVSPNPLVESRRNYKIVRSCYSNLFSVYKNVQIEHQLEDDSLKKIKYLGSSKSIQSSTSIVFDSDYQNGDNYQSITKVKKNVQERSKARLYLSLIQKRRVEAKKLQKLKKIEMKIKTDQIDTENIVTQMSDQMIIISKSKMKQEIEISKQVIKGLTNQINSILGISLFELFSISTLFDSKDRLFSTNFTKCVYISAQVSLTLLVNVIQNCLDQVEAEDEGEIDFQNLSVLKMVLKKRVMVSLFFGYAIPYFFFGLLTNIFAKLSKGINRISIRIINLLRSNFVKLYSVIGLVIFGISTAGILTLTQNQIDKLQISLVVIEVLIVLIIQFTVLDGLFFILAFFLNDFQDDVKMFFSLLACRGYYFFENFDNSKAYKYYYENQKLNERKLKHDEN